MSLKPKQFVPGLAGRHADEIDAIMAKYPIRRSGVMDVLRIVQREVGWVPPEAMGEVAEVCHMQGAEVMAMVSFYTMYHRQPVGKFVLAVCNTMPCALCGSMGLMSYLKEKLGADLADVTRDGMFTIKQVECLGACSEAPMMLVNETLATKLTRAKVDEILDRCRAGESLEGLVPHAHQTNGAKA